MVKVHRLVRDNVPKMIAAAGGRPVLRILNDEEFIDAVDSKIIEEATEFAAAQTRDGVLAEIADLKEILLVKATYYNISQEDIEKERKTRARIHGTFTKRIFLEEK